MTLSLVSAPEVDPVSLEEAKAHLRVEHSLEDDLIVSAIKAATGHAETFTRRQFVTAVWELWLDRWPCLPLAQHPLRIPRPPLVQVVSVQYVDPTGSLRSWPATEYQVSVPVGRYAPRGRLAPAYGRRFPALRHELDAVRVLFRAGYGAPGAVPDEIKRAILLLVGELYAHRELSIVGTATLTRLPFAVEALLWPFRDLEFA